MKWLQVLKDWLWVATIAGGAILVWGSLPQRMTKVEATQARQETQVSELREWTKETQGFLKGQAQLNERLANQTHPSPAPAVSEVSDDGEVKTFLMDGKKLCCDGTDCWAWKKKTKCERE